jgi:hypothetical protein
MRSGDHIRYINARALCEKLWPQLHSFNGVIEFHTHQSVLAYTHTHGKVITMQTAFQGDVTSSWALKYDSLK